MTALLALEDRPAADHGVASPSVTEDRTPGLPGYEVAFDQTAVRRVAKPSGRLRVKRDNRKVFGEWVVIIALALGVALLVRHFVIQTFSIPTASMQPTLMVKDRLLVEKLSFQYREIRRGEIIVFHAPERVKRATDGKEQDFVKRVIGLPGDTVEVNDNKVIVNGTVLNETYLPAGTVTTSRNQKRWVVPVDAYFVMGDNRGNSFDSREWDFVPRPLVVGRVLFRVYPLGRAGSVS
jgi:signal peptidase I